MILEMLFNCAGVMFLSFFIIVIKQYLIFVLTQKAQIQVLVAYQDL